MLLLLQATVEQLLEQIVKLLIFQSPEPRPLGALSPWLDCRFQMSLEVALALTEARTHQRFLKSHLPLDALPMYAEVRYIHVARDDRDACMSSDINEAGVILVIASEVSVHLFRRVVHSGGAERGAADEAWYATFAMLM